MINIKFESYWEDCKIVTNEYFVSTPNGNGIFNNIFLNYNNYDYTIVQGSCDLNKLNLKKTILIQAEPEYYRNKNYDNYFLNEDNYHNFKIVYDIKNNHSVMNWLLDATFDDILKIDLCNKLDKIFMLFSDKTETENHKSRLFFIKNYLIHFNFIDSYYTNDYNSIFKTIKNKNIYNTNNIFVPYSNYKYIFQVENSNERNYFTEKIIRSILCGCLTLYCGCENLEDFIHPGCFIRIDLNKPEESIDNMYRCIHNREWEKRIDIIMKQKEILMTHNNPLNIIESLILYNKFEWKKL